MPDTETLGTSSRDILIEVRGLVRQLIESRDDHEIRLRANEKSTQTLQDEKRTEREATRRLIGWGMFLAAMAGGFGNAIMKALSH